MCSPIQTLLSCLLDSLWGNTGKVMGKFKVPNFSMWILLLRLFSLFFHIAYHSQGEKWLISLSLCLTFIACSAWEVLQIFKMIL